jgi:hypothetical protein
MKRTHCGASCIDPDPSPPVLMARFVRVVEFAPVTYTVVIALPCVTSLATARQFGCKHSVNPSGERVLDGLIVG